MYVELYHIKGAVLRCINIVIIHNNIIMIQFVCRSRNLIKLTRDTPRVSH